MLQKPSTCSGCVLEHSQGGFAHPDGRCKTGVLIIGEALGDREKFDGLCFRPYAEAGSALMTAIRLLGFKREDFAYWNMLGCQPPYNNLENTAYEYQSIEHCKVHFNQVLKRYNPKVILALGNVPLKHLRAPDPEIDAYIQQLELTDPKKLKDYLKKFKISSLRGYILPTIYGIPMIPSLHPSFITREGRIYIGVLMRDIKAAIDLSQGNIPDFKVNYNTDPTIKEAEKFYQFCKANVNLAISHDIETPDTALTIDESEIEYENIEVRDIDSIQFSIKEGESIFFPWFGEYIEITRKILALLNPKTGWNSRKFDKVNIEYHLGLGAIAGLNIDAMDAWKWLNQDFVKMGRGLQFVTNFFTPNFPAWKHLAQLNPKLYGCYDPDAALRNYNGLFRELSARRLFPDTKSLWEGFIDDVIKLRPILDDTTKRGFPIDPIKREDFRQQIHSERELTLNQLQDIYPMQLRKVTPAEGYKFVPKEVYEVDELFEKASNIKNKGIFYIVENDETVDLRKAQYLEEHTRRVEDTEEEKLKTTGLIIKEFSLKDENEKTFKELRYCRMEMFKPNSRNQVLEYIKWKGYKVPKKRDRTTGEEKETTSKDELYHIAEEHPEDPFLKLVVLYRELDHLESTYIGKKTVTKSGKVKLTGWQPNAENRINAEFLTKPATGQLSTNPNIQNAPARGTFFSSPGYAKLAQQFRQIVAAQNGKVLLSADWSAFHALTQSIESNDPEYMRVVKIDPHSFVAAHILSTDLALKINKKKPDNISTEDWKKKQAINEEALDRFKNLHSWLSLSDEKLTENLAFIKKNYKMVRDSQAKPALLGMGFGMGVKKFYKLNRHTFKSEAEPNRILNLIRKLFPKTFVEFHTKIKDLADRQTYLISRYGYIRRFYNVYDWRMQTKPRTIRAGEQQIRNSRGEWWIRKDGTDAEAAIAYLPANHAFGKKKEAMRDLWEFEKDGIVRNLIQEFGLINEIHDDLLFEVEEDKLEEAAVLVKTIMEKPAQYIRTPLVPNGLICKVELKAGRNWASFSKDNPNGMKDLII